MLTDIRGAYRRGKRDCGLGLPKGVPEIHGYTEGRLRLSYVRGFSHGQKRPKGYRVGDPIAIDGDYQIITSIEEYRNRRTLHTKIGSRVDHKKKRGSV